MTSPAVVQVAVTVGTGARIHHVARRLAAWCRLSPTADDGAPVLASHVDALPSHRAAGAPVCVWVAAADSAASLLARPPAGITVISDDAGVIAATCGPAVPVPASGIDSTTVPWVPPFVRRRLRRLHRLPDELVIDDAALSSAPELSATMLAVASAVVTADPATVAHALALGAPTVTSPGTAEALVLVAGREVAVAAPDDAPGRARRIARDDRAAVALSLAGRRWAEGSRDPHRAARRVARALGLDPAPPDPVVAALDELLTPPASPVRARALAASQVFEP